MCQELPDKLKTEKLHKSAVIVQSVVCCVMVRRRFLRLKNASITIQKHWRRILASRDVVRSSHDSDKCLKEVQRSTVNDTDVLLKEFFFISEGSISLVGDQSSLRPIIY